MRQTLPFQFIVDKNGNPSPPFLQWLQNLDWDDRTIKLSGPTAQRPVSSATATRWVGMSYFDTDLGYPVFLKSITPDVWVDATGGIV